MNRGVAEAVGLDGEDFSDLEQLSTSVRSFSTLGGEPADPVASADQEESSWNFFLANKIKPLWKCRKMGEKYSISLQ